MLSVAAPIVAGAVAQGVSLGVGRIPKEPSVVVVTEIKNNTKYTLSNVETKLEKGSVQIVPPVIAPGEKEMMVAHKKPYVPTGSSGVVSWTIVGKKRRIVIMWSAPFNFDHYSNYMAVGMTEENDTEFDDNWFNLMYNEKNTASLNYIRKKFCKKISSISFEDSEFEILATMGTTHKPWIQVVVNACEKDLASNELNIKIPKRGLFSILGDRFRP